MIKLIGILIVVIGTTFEFNMLLTILAAAFATGLAGGMEPVAILGTIGSAFSTHRFLSFYLLILPLVGMLGRRGMYEKIESDFQKARKATAGHILQLYMTIRQFSVSLGLFLAGHAVARALVVPMVLEAARREGRLLPSLTDRVKATIVATENCGNFFGQCLFIASGGVILVRSVMGQAGYQVSILRLILFAIPTALAAYAIVLVRCSMLDMALRREAWKE